MIRRALVALSMLAAPFTLTACNSDPTCLFTCIDGEPGPAQTDTSGRQKQQDLYDPDAHHQVSDRTGDREAINKEKADNAKRLADMCAKDPKLCGR